MKTCTASETCAHLVIDFDGFCADMETRRTWGPRCQGFRANPDHAGSTIPHGASRLAHLRALDTEKETTTTGRCSARSPF